MSEIYNKACREQIFAAADALDIPVQKGVYVQLTGPNYESPSEVKMCRLIGGDAVGMSTACEAIAANHMGMKVCGISCITNMASGISKVPLSHIEVKETADRVAPLFKTWSQSPLSELPQRCDSPERKRCVRETGKTICDLSRRSYDTDLRTAIVRAGGSWCRCF